MLNSAIVIPCLIGIGCIPIKPNFSLIGPYTNISKGLGLSNTITEIERGGSNIIISKVIKLNEAYNKPNDYFIKLGFTYNLIFNRL